MAFQNLSLLFFLIIILSLFSPTSLLRHHSRPLRPPDIFYSSTSPSRFHQPHISTSLFLSTFSLPSTSHYSATVPGGGEWTLLQQSVGVSAMHMQLLYDNKVIIFDRTDFGASNLTLPAGKCRYNDEAISEDCTAHSLLYDIASNAYRPLSVQTDVWCSSGAVNSDGTLIQTGGYHAGDHKIRLFTTCNDDQCDWIELAQNLTVQRWYATDQFLPDGRVIILGGRRAFSYEFFPKNSINNSVFYFPFLKETTDPKEENNLYPFLYLLPDGNLFVFANQRSVALDYKNNKIVKEFPAIPGEKRSYPATGSSVMLPLKLGYGFPVEVEVMVCGGAKGGAYVKAARGLYMAASKSCGRIRVTDRDPKWEMEDMPMGRVMLDMLLLPTGDVIILNGAARGTAGWECAVDPVLNPVLYYPNVLDPSRRFSVLNPTTIARLYHSTTILLPDGRVLVGGSNPHVRYNFTGVKYPTELSLEAFSPPYMASEHAHLRPSILSIETPNNNLISYGQQFAITLSLGLYQPAGEYIVTMAAPSFTTHSFAMNQRLLVLHIVDQQQLSAFGYKINVQAPPIANIAPPGYYMLFVVHQGIPSHGVWIKIK
ncbi:Galactose oxidase [Handroanthus impetiginosus]|uniref:Galactose oxidase n=1 Tax=Handroanthus impetiginosus TaxID=429701 RepID=A0A2G9HHK2_9LAMI|nr:Galactose oxidase [Handroanthus impetiginosus]